MGCCGSRPQQEPYMGTDVGSKDPFSTLFDLHKGVCRIGTDAGSGTGFLCQVSFQGETRQWELFGVITNSYTLDVRDLANPFTMTFDIHTGGKRSEFSKTINPRERFRFSCAVLDTTFVHFRPDEVRDLRSHGRLFLKLDTEWGGKRGEEVLIVQEKLGLKTRFTSGTFIRDHGGLYLLHTSKAEIGSWGSPLALKDGRVIGMHKRRAAKKIEQVDVAVASKAIVKALGTHCSGDTLSVKLISNPIRFNETSESRILEHDLARCADRDNRLLSYVTPDRNLGKGRSEQDEDLPLTVNPVWFVPTNHGWYWSPTDPFDRTRETNWMSVDTRVVVGGKDQHKGRMCKEDWEIAKWLKRTGNIKNTKN